MIYLSTLFYLENSDSHSKKLLKGIFIWLDIIKLLNNVVSFISL